MAQFYNERVFYISDYTRLEGFFQSERYLKKNRENILQWFALKENPNLYNFLGLDRDICVINFRGEDYKLYPHWYLSPNYWLKAAESIRRINPSINFVVITNDIEEAKIFFPHLPIFNFGVENDLFVISRAKYLIIANSSFSWWGAWLNQNSLLTIAPKYWLAHNAQTSWWSPSDAITSKFSYLDRAGLLQSYQECATEQKTALLNPAGFPY